MTSSTVPQIEGWRLWCDATVKTAPEGMGIYVLRLENGKSTPRLVGDSDILYIGKAVKRGIRARLKDRLKDDLPLQRVAREVAGVEAGWRVLATEHDTCLLESELIARYEYAHVELPPLNRSQPWQKVQKAKKFFKSLGKSGEAVLRAAKDAGYSYEIEE